MEQELWAAASEFRQEDSRPVSASVRNLFQQA